MSGIWLKCTVCNEATRFETHTMTIKNGVLHTSENLYCCFCSELIKSAEVLNE